MEDAESVRLAIALIALRHKPANQSCASYVLSLQERFPLQGSSPASALQGADPPDRWRARVCELEKEVQDLQAKYDSQCIDLAASRVTPSSANNDAGSVPACPAPTPVPGKKKPRKKGSSTSGPPIMKMADKCLDDTLRGTLNNASIPELSSPNQLFSSLQALDTLLEARRQRTPAVTLDVCASAANRALDSLAATLDSLLGPTRPTSATSSVIQALTSLLTRFLLASLPVLCSSRKTLDTENCASSLDALFGRLANGILAPAVSCFSRLSSAHLTSIFSPGASSSKASNSKRGAQRASHDVRPDALNFVRMTLESLHVHALSASGNRVLIAHVQAVHEALSLCAVREIEKLYRPPPASAATATAAPAPGTGRPPAPPAPNAIGETDWEGSSLPQLSSPQLQDPVRRLEPTAPTPTPTEPTAREELQGPTSVRANRREPAPGAQSHAEARAPRRRPSPADRIEELARKDALWYLCSVLHCTIPGAALGLSIPEQQEVPPRAGKTYSGTAPPPAAGEMLRAGVCTVLAGLLRRAAVDVDVHVCGGVGGGEEEGGWIGDEGEGLEERRGPRRSVCRGRRLLGNVEREMLLAVAEKVWLSQG